MESKEQNKHNGNRLIDTENTLVSDRGEEVGAWVKKVKGSGSADR